MKLKLCLKDLLGNFESIASEYGCITNDFNSHNRILSGEIPIEMVGAAIAELCSTESGGTF